MEPEKTVGLSFRITPRMKRLLEAAAANERRSLTNTLEVLVEDYCRRHGIEDQEDAVRSKAETARERK
ncbi:MAG TPA: hypothetical protein VLA61_12840 [Ideonella sp.]|uniref:hypothetical protein n=1 Tax=Ideonella sp. TaxID=1929293 RepID=UPI002B9BA925|nr:hypothetical protein [Ideonella sp.]HSI49151.1 hypothetical protein [Ideonella sp.]